MSFDTPSFLNEAEQETELNRYVFPKPLLNKRSRTFNKVGYKTLVLEDDLMKDVKSLIHYGDSVFNNVNNIVDLTDVESIRKENPNPTIPSNVIQMNDIAQNFYLTFKPHNGNSSLRRGFYKLLPIPVNVPILDFSTWETHVLFNEGPQNNITYKYNCHVGPLVNKYAICRNLTRRRFLKLPNDNTMREEFLKKYQGTTIYVSSAEMVKEDNYIMKELLWFVW